MLHIEGRKAEKIQGILRNDKTEFLERGKSTKSLYIVGSMGCTKLKYQNFSFLEIVHSKKKVSEEKKRVNYYPFGLEHKGYNNVVNGTENNYKTFQGQEISKELGLNWHLFKYRTYDASIGRFLQIDPMARGYEYNSTYAFAENKVTSGVDMEGLEQWYTTDGSLVTGVSGPLNINTMNKVGLFTYDQVQTKRKQERALRQLLDRTSSAIPKNDQVRCNCLIHQAQRMDPHLMLGYSMGSQIRDGMIIMAGDELFNLALKGLGALVRGRTVWRLNRFARGRAIEAKLGENLGWNFPTIDKISNGVATSIKSVDLTAKSYQKGNTLFNTLKKYINKVDDFSGANWAGQNIQEGIDFSSKAIELGINPNKASIGQWEQIAKAMDLAKKKGIDFKLKFFK